MKILVISTGEPAGIGPDIAIQAALKWQSEKMHTSTQIVLVGDFDTLKRRAQLLSIPQSAWQSLEVCPVELSDSEPVVAGRLNPNHASYVLRVLEQALALVRQDPLNRALVTAPVHKEIVHRFATDFSGHTEFLAQQLNVDQVVMMLATVHQKMLRGTSDAYTKPFRVALASTHLPLKDVSACLMQAGIFGLLNTLRITHYDLMRSFGLKNPVIFVAGLNPHAGEGGVLGDEEINLIKPAIELAQQEGICAQGPFSADTLFQPKYLNECDVVLAMYHDQGLPVLKYAGFGEGTNITLGLPIVRTSVDHGTALTLAGTATASFDSMFAALDTANHMLECRSNH